MEPGFEYRFRGLLSEGGKLRTDRDRWWVSCHPEDMTPDRFAAMDAANSRLADLRATEMPAV
jgi:hypothetical protein